MTKITKTREHGKDAVITVEMTEWEAQQLVRAIQDPPGLNFSHPWIKDLVYAARN